jgi:large conductance mechanosensitive channel
MSMVSEFKAFAMRGSVVDMAVGVVIGAAFGKIVASLVEGLIMPVVGLATGGIDFSDFKVMLTDESALGVGKVVQSVIDFTLIAFVLFLIIKAVNAARAKEQAAPAAPPEPPAEVRLLTEIRDLLRSRQ